MRHVIPVAHPPSCEEDDDDYDPFTTLPESEWDALARLQTASEATLYFNREMDSESEKESHTRQANSEAEEEKKEEPRPKKIPRTI